MDEIEVIGLLDEGGYELANRVYSQDGISPTIRTFQGGGLEPKFVEIRQATKEGTIPCMVGGGSGPKLSEQQDKARKSDSKWNGISHTYNGGYP